MYSGGLKLYWVRMCEHAEIYLVTQCRGKKGKNSKCIFFLIALSLPPKLSLPVTLVIRNSKPCGAPLPLHP